MADMFLWLQDIEGESLDEDHEKEIEIMQWSWTMNNPASLKLSQQNQSTKVVINDIQIQKAYDKASVTLVKYLTTGQHISDAIIACRKNAGDGKVEYLQIRLKDVMVKDITWSGGDRDVSPETVKLNFAEFELTYTLQEADGFGTDMVNYGFDITAQKPK